MLCKGFAEKGHGSEIGPEPCGHWLNTLRKPCGNSRTAGAKRGQMREEQRKALARAKGRRGSLDMMIRLSCSWHATSMLLLWFWYAFGVLWRAVGMLPAWFGHAPAVFLACFRRGSDMPPGMHPTWFRHASFVFSNFGLVMFLQCLWHATGVLLACSCRACGMLLACSRHAPMACFWRAGSVLLLCCWRAVGMLPACFCCGSGMLLACWHAVGVLLACSRHGSGMHSACSWRASGCASSVHLLCFWHVHGVLLACFWNPPAVVPVCSWRAPGTFLAHVWCSYKLLFKRMLWKV